MKMNQNALEQFLSCLKIKNILLNKISSEKHFEKQLIPHF
jgi:hypothetical protein